MDQPNPADSTRVLSRAKVNLFLRVGPRRADGFHGLTSWFCKIGLNDELVFTRTEGGEVSLSCDVPAVPCDSTNLILKAVELLRPYAAKCEGLHITLRKRIPMGGGLGGGSSNAAAVLSALNKPWGCGLSFEKMHEIAARLGSDVPFFLQTPSAICRGRGELISPLRPPTAKAILLVLPKIEMPTPAVYRKFDEMGLGTDLAEVEATLPHPEMNTDALLASLVNDLEAPAFAISPVLGRLRDDVEQRISRPVRMSGSGSTLFTLYDDEQEAHSAAQQLGCQLRAITCALG